jgi:peptidoglycan hydrolase FlgJ
MDISAASFDQARFAMTSAPAPKAGTTLNATQVKKSAEDFEAFFISQFVETMLSGIKTDGPFGGGNAEGIYRSMMAQEYGKSIAASGGLGIADSVQKAMIQMQENAQ